MKSLIGEQNQNYIITKQCDFDTTTAVVLAYHPRKEEWVVWRAKQEEDFDIYYHGGSYYTNLNKAMKEYFSKIERYAKCFKEFYQRRIEQDIIYGV